MAYATFTCPKCGDEQYPMLHTVGSDCGGSIYWDGDTLYCEDCDTEITRFRCDACGYRPGYDSAS